MVGLSLEEPAETVRQELAAGGHPRRPVCRGDLDEVAGALHLRQPVDPLLAGGSALDLEALPGKPPLIVHEGTSVLRVIERLRQTPAHLAMMPGAV